MDCESSDQELVIETPQPAADTTQLTESNDGGAADSRAPKINTCFKVDCKWCGKLISKNNVGAHEKRCKIKKFQDENLTDNNPNLLEKIRNLQMQVEDLHKQLQNRNEQFKVETQEITHKYQTEYKMRIEADRKYDKLVDSLIILKRDNNSVVV